MIAVSEKGREGWGFSDLRDFRVGSDFRVFSDFRVGRDFRDLRVFSDLRDLKDIKDLKDPNGFKAFGVKAGRGESRALY